MVLPYTPHIRLGTTFQLPERLALAARMSVEELNRQWLNPFVGQESGLQEWLDRKTDAQAMNTRMTAAFLLTHADLWKLRIVEKPAEPKKTQRPESAPKAEEKVDEEPGEYEEEEET